jgi:hypothetical protein
VDSDDDDFAPTRRRGVARKGGAKELWPLNVDSTGWATLPEVDHELSPGELKDIIRSVVTQAYSKSIFYHSIPVC